MSAEVLPLGQSAEDREAFINALCVEFGPFIQDVLRGRRDLVEESKKDLQQKVLLILAQRVRDERVPDNVEAFLAGVIRKVVANHKGKWKPDVEPGADVYEVSGDQDLEGAVELAERRKKLERYLVRLPQELAEVVRCVDLFEMTLEDTAAAVRRPMGTVSSQLTRARAALKELARASEPPPGR